MSSQQGRKIAMVGAAGTIGSVTLSALLEQNIHTITAITRTESTSTFPSNVTVKKGSYADPSFLASVLSGQDVLIIQVGYMPEAMASQIPLIEAAAAAGVRWVLPTEFGSDPFSQIAIDFPMTGEKKAYRDLIEAKGMKWVAVVNNPWFDWSMKQNLWGVDILGKKATLNNHNADTKFSAATLGQVGRGVAKLLSLGEDELEGFANRGLYVRSFSITQREIFHAAICATGTKEEDWEVKLEEPEDVVQASRDAVAAGNPFGFIWEFILAHMQKGRGGDYEEKAAKDAAIIGLESESLDEVVKRVTKELEGQK
ncbi:hypothetical protein GQ44DRAFT_698209 [Phaeosphaeriaceae sp. PMI808]|nr:hypothetical protein GQ44DRAFT_698209 [Phaeosphaeriaceae sp. PMI808]